MLSSDRLSDQPSSSPEDVLSLGLLLYAFWHGRRIFFVSIGITVFLAALYLAFLSRPVYEASAKIGPSVGVSSGGSSSGTSSALSSIIGIGVGGGQSSEFDKFTQVMTSSRLAEDLEARYGFMHDVLGNWDEKNKRWLQPEGVFASLHYSIGRMLGEPAWAPPSSAEFARRLSKLVKVDSTVDPTARAGSSGTRVSLDYGSPQLAAQMLNEFLKDADDLVRQDRATNSANRVAYLTAQLDHTTDLTLRENLQNLLLREQQSLMVLHADRFYSFDMIDPPTVDTTPIAPHPTLVLLEAAALGALFAAAYVFALLWRRIKGETPNVEAFFGSSFPSPVTILMRRIRR